MFFKVLAFFTVLHCAKADLEACLAETAEVVFNFATVLPTNATQYMALYSGKEINDLGNYAGCCDLEGANYALFTAYIDGLAFKVGFCGPEICTEEDYYEIIANLSQALPSSHPLTFFTVNLNSFDTDAQLSVLQHNQLLQQSQLPITIAFPQVYIHDYFTNLSTGAIFMIVICIFLVLVASFGTVLDILQSQHKQVVTEEYELMGKSANNGSVNADESTTTSAKSQSLLVGLLLCFSVYTNFPKLFSSRSAEKVGQKKDTLDILNAVRVMSMGWVILGHTWAYRALITVLKNPSQYILDLQYAKTAIIYGGLYSVDTFFWLSGFLMAFLLLQQLNTKRSLSSPAWAYLYGHRFYRILPAYMFILFFTWAFTKYVGNGPLWTAGDLLNSDCHDYWWTNMLFINNFVPNGNGSGCIGQSWYLANDMQFFIISPPIFFLYHKVSKVVGWVLVSSLGVCAILCGCILTKNNDYNAVFIAPENTTNNFMADYYIKPYCRVAPYALGIVSGMILYSYRNFKRSGEVYDKYALWMGKALEKPVVRFSCVGVGLFLINILMFIQIDAYKDYENGWTNWTQTENVLFIGFSRFFWGVGLSLVLLPMLLGYIPIATWFLSLSIWAPFARLTFCTYLIHLHLIFIYYLSQDTAFWFDDLNVIVDLFFIVLISYAAAVPLTLLVESPFMAFEKLMKSRNGKERVK